MSRTESFVCPSGQISTACSGTNLGSAVIMVRPEPLWGSSSFARSRRYSSAILGRISSSMKRLTKVDLPERTGPVTPRYTLPPVRRSISSYSFIPRPPPGYSRPARWGSAAAAPGQGRRPPAHWRSGSPGRCCRCPGRSPRDPRRRSARSGTGPRALGRGSESRRRGSAGRRSDSSAPAGSGAGSDFSPAAWARPPGPGRSASPPSAPPAALPGAPGAGACSGGLRRRPGRGA